ncbi:hypothetical protein LINPERHAP1_LOCUS30172 [Linum perenne]
MSATSGYSNRFVLCCQNFV